MPDAFKTEEELDLKNLRDYWDRIEQIWSWLAPP